MNALKPLIIGSIDLENVNSPTNCLVESYKDLKLDYKLVQISQSDIGSLKSENVDCLAFPLQLVPVKRPEELVIAGLSERQEVNLKILTLADKTDLNQILKLKQQCHIGVQEVCLKEQILKLFPEYRVSLYKEKHLLESALLESNIDAIADWDQKEIQGYAFYSVKPNELIPPPGLGVYAYLALRSNLSARKSIQQIHESEVAYCTNVERKILRYLGAETLVAAHCKIDRMGNYHLDLFAKEKNGGFEKIKISQSTFIQLAENACRKLSYEVPDI